jgi:hypothetical protein
VYVVSATIAPCIWSPISYLELWILRSPQTTPKTGVFSVCTRTVQFQPNAPNQECNCRIQMSRAYSIGGSRKMTWFCIRISCTIGLSVRLPSIAYERMSSQQNRAHITKAHLFVLSPLRSLLHGHISNDTYFSSRVIVLCAVKLGAPQLDDVGQTDEQYSLNSCVELCDPIVQVRITFEIQLINLYRYGQYTRCENCSTR